MLRGIASPQRDRKLDKDTSAVATPQCRLRNSLSCSNVRLQLDVARGYNCYLTIVNKAFEISEVGELDPLTYNHG